MSISDESLLAKNLLALQQEQRCILKQLTQQTSELSSLVTEMRRIQKELEHLNRLVRDGNGQPPLIHRATVLEKKLEEIERCVSQQRQQDRKFQELHENYRLTLRQKLILLVAGMGITMGSTALTELLIHSRPSPTDHQAQRDVLDPADTGQTSQ